MAITKPNTVLIPTAISYRTAENRTIPLTNYELDGNFAFLHDLVDKRVEKTDFTATNLISILNENNTASNANGLNVNLLRGYAPDTDETSNTVVLRDGSGNFTANNITATNFLGLATEASKAYSLANSLSINGVAFDGTKSIEVGLTLNGVSIAIDTFKNNVAITDWWGKSDIEWTQKSGTNKIIFIPAEITGVYNPKNTSDHVWKLTSTQGTNNTINGGGWQDGTTLKLDPEKTYRFVIPVRRLPASNTNVDTPSISWGVQNVSKLDSDSQDSLGLFVNGFQPDYTDRWYLLVGYVYANQITNATNDTAGIWDCKTGNKLLSENYAGKVKNFRFIKGYSQVFHTLFQTSKLVGSSFISGRPVISLVDGSEATLSTFFDTNSALLNTSITINNNGTLSGAGSGKVTMYGLGYSKFTVSSVGNAVPENVKKTKFTTTNASAGTKIIVSGTQSAITGSYILHIINKADGVVESTTYYSLNDNQIEVAEAEAGALANKLNNTPSDKVVVIQTHGDAYTNRKANGLAAAMYRCGASSSVFGSPKFQRYSAYILIGIPGCGAGNGAEYYQGDARPSNIPETDWKGDSNAWVETTFSIVDGEFTAGLGTYTPSTLEDYGYTGDYNASYGANSSNLNVGLGINLLSNSNFTNNSIAGWSFSGTPENKFTQTINTKSYTLLNDGVVSIYENGITGNYSSLDSEKILVTPNTKYEVSALVGSLRSSVDIIIKWYRANDELISTGPSIGITNDSESGKNGGNTLASYKQIGGFVISPNNAAMCVISIRKSTTKPNNANSYAFITRAFFGNALPSQTVLSPWVAGYTNNVRALGYTGALNATRNINRGEWLPDTVYEIGDIVSHNGSSWACLISNSSITPGEKVQYWALQAQKGDRGIAATRTAVLDMYKWSAEAPPDVPYGKAEYTWKTGQFKSPTTIINQVETDSSNGWTLAPATPVINQKLWICRVIYTDRDESETSKISFDSYKVFAITSSGAHGQRYGFLELYKWSKLEPTSNFPSGTSEYTWETGEFTLPKDSTGTDTSNGWRLSPDAPEPGQLLWGISVSISNADITKTSTVTWESTSPYAVGLAGETGPAGYNSLVAMLSNGAHLIPADTDGKVTNYAGSGTLITVYDGTKKLTGIRSDEANLGGTYKIGTITTNPKNAINNPVLTYEGDYVRLADYTWVDDKVDVITVDIPITVNTDRGQTVTLTEIRQTLTKSKTGKTGVAGPTITLLTNRDACFTSTDGTLNGNQTDLIVTASVYGIAGAVSYTWGLTGFQSDSLIIKNKNELKIPATAFGTSKAAYIKCTVENADKNVLIYDTMTVVRLEKSTAAAGATVGATLGLNVIDYNGKVVTYDSIRNNLAEVSWWAKGATIPWQLNANDGNSINKIIQIPSEIPGIMGPKGGSAEVWYSKEYGDGDAAGGWYDGKHVTLDTSKTYRFAIAIRKISGTSHSVWGFKYAVNLFTETKVENSYFAHLDIPETDRWYLFVGYIFPKGTHAVGKTDDEKMVSFNQLCESAGVWDCKTGQKIAGGGNYAFHASGIIYHQVRLVNTKGDSEHLFSIPMINLIDGTEPSLREYFEPASMLNTAISINEDGTLSGAGIGRVKLNGLGYNTYTVVSEGLMTTRNDNKTTPKSPGLYVNDEYAFGSVRSYTLVKIARNNGNIVFYQGYDVYGNGDFTSGRNSKSLADELNSTNSDYIVVIYTYDEPRNNRLDNGLADAMYRCGASRAVFGSPKFKSRSAYALIGIPDWGEGNGAEYYQGKIDDDTNAWIYANFSIVNGLIQTSGSYTPSSLEDYGYSGHYNATYGADSSNLAVGIGTNLLPNANFTENMLGWKFHSTVYAYVSQGINLNNDWTAQGIQTPYIRQWDADESRYGYYYSEVMPVIAGNRYETFCYIGAHRCKAGVLIHWYNSSNGYIQQDAVDYNKSTQDGGRFLSGYSKTGGFVTAPSGATFARVLLIKEGTMQGIGAGDSWAFFVRPFFGRANAGQKELSTWSMGPPASQQDKTNFINLDFWTKYNPMGEGWYANEEVNGLINASDIGITGPKNSNDVIWYAKEVTGDIINTPQHHNAGGGWNSYSTLTLDHTKTYRFTIPIMALSGDGDVYWGTHNVCYLNNGIPEGNPYFAAIWKGHLIPRRWYLFVGYVYPSESSGYTSDSAGIWDCNTGQKISDGTNWNHASGGAHSHRAYQYYANKDSETAFGRPFVHLVDGTEPPLTDYFNIEILNNKLNKASSEILNIDATSATRIGGIKVGDISWDGNGSVTSGKGLALTPAGLIGHNGSKTTFAINASTGNATFGGELTAASGSFAGELKAATGSFSGELKAATGTFSGDLSAATGTFSGELKAATGTFSGELKAATGSFSGELKAATGTFSGELKAATGSFSGELKAATGTFSGDLSAATGTFSGELKAATGTFSGDLSAATGTFSGNLNVKSSPSGARMEITTSSIKVYDINGRLRVVLGQL